jgi:hypothetical protein
MTDTELLDRIGVLVKSERRITRELLELIVELDKRKLHIDRGYCSLYDFLVRSYGYSQSGAHRRIQAAKLLAEVPGLSQKLDEGTVNLTTLTQLQCIVRQEERRTGEKVAPTVKIDLVKKIEGKTSDESEREIRKVFPEAQPTRESLRAIGHERSKLTLVLLGEDVDSLQRTKELLSHSCTGWSEVVGYLAKFYLKKKDPMLRK